MTPFEKVYDAFFNLITDDMYVEFSEEDTQEACQGLLMLSIPLFEFPDKPLDFNEDEEAFLADLNLEERNILAWGMHSIWLQQQVSSIENIRQKFSGADFKLTSQASHLQRLIALLNLAREEHKRLQMLYSRRQIGRDGKYESTFGMLTKKI